MEHNCPSLTELQDLIHEGHDLSALGGCVRCRAMVRLLQTRSGGPGLAFDFGDGLESPTVETTIPRRGGADTDLKPGSLVSVVDSETGSRSLLLGAVTVVREDTLELTPLRRRHIRPPNGISYSARTTATSATPQLWRSGTTEPSATSRSRKGLARWPPS